MVIRVYMYCVDRMSSSHVKQATCNRLFFLFDCQENKHFHFIIIMKDRNKLFRTAPFFERPTIVLLLK